MICFLNSNKASNSTFRDWDKWKQDNEIKKTVRSWREMDLDGLAILRNWEGQNGLFTRGDKFSSLYISLLLPWACVDQYKQKETSTLHQINEVRLN